MKNYLIKISKDKYINITKNKVNDEDGVLYFYYDNNKYVVKNMLEVVGKDENLNEWDLLLNDGTIKTIPTQYIFSADDI